MLRHRPVDDNRAALSYRSHARRPILEESLKALRLTHRTLLVLLAGVLLFALSPSRHETYEKAYAFLDRLQGIDDDAYRSWAQEVADQYLVSRHDFLRTLFKEVVNRGGPVIEWEHIDNQTITQMLTFSQTGPRIDDGSLESLNRVFRDDIPVRELFLPVDRLASVIRNDLDPEHAYRLDNIVISGTVGIGRMDVQLYLYDAAGGVHNVFGTAKFGNRPLDGQSFRVWLTDNGNGNLLSQADAGGVIFEPLRPLWPFIYAKPIADAKDWIQHELLRLGDAQVLSVFGISITEYQAGIAAPGITLILLFVLAAQLRHVIRLIPSGDDEYLRAFPWIPMFAGSVGWIGRSITLLALPVLANGWLLLRAQGTITWAGWIEWVLVIGSGAWAFREAGRVSDMREARAQQITDSMAESTNRLSNAQGR